MASSQERISSSVHLLKMLDPDAFRKLKEKYPDINFSGGRTLGNDSSDVDDLLTCLEASEVTLRSIKRRSSYILKHITKDLKNAARFRVTSVCVALVVSAFSVGAIFFLSYVAPIIAGLTLISNAAAALASYKEFGFHHRSASPIDNLHQLKDCEVLADECLLGFHKIKLLSEEEKMQLLDQANNVSVKTLEVIRACGYPTADLV